MERWVAKLLAVIGTFILPFLCTILPIKVYDFFTRKGKLGQMFLSWLMCFGGSVFFATFMLHMGPEVRRILDQALMSPYGIWYPVADLIMAVGFFLVLVIEKTALKFHRHHGKKSQPKQCTPLDDVTVNHQVGQDTDAENSEAVANLNPDRQENGTGDEVIHFDVSDPIHAELHIFEQNARSLVLALALSLHRIFEGMSVGLKHTVLGVGNLFLAVMCHETVIGFSLGLQFVRNGFSTKRTLISSFLCSVIMPVGVAIGTIIMEVGEESASLNIVNGVLQALSTGTFIYVTFFEILHDEITHSDTSIGKVIWLIIGFVVMAALCSIPEPPEVTEMTLAKMNFTEAVITQGAVTTPV